MLTFSVKVQASLGSLPVQCFLCFHIGHLLFSPFSFLRPALGILGDPCLAPSSTGVKQVLGCALQLSSVPKS